ncbi:hypothetical protein GCM10022249_11580 [Enteractinococcus coprophilus]
MRASWNVDGRSEDRDQMHPEQNRDRGHGEDRRHLERRHDVDRIHGRHQLGWAE